MANQTWEFREFPGPRPDGENNAVVFLNEPARQGRGEATATLRNDGSVGLFYLVPGDLGASTTQTWHFKEFPAPDGVTSALAFLNASPRQGAGEVSGYARNDGSASDVARLVDGARATATSCVGAALRAGCCPSPTSVQAT